MYISIIKYFLSVDVRNQIMSCANLDILGRKAKKSERYSLFPYLRCNPTMPVVLFILLILFLLPLSIKTKAFYKKEIHGLHKNNKLSLEKIWVLKT